MIYQGAQGVLTSSRKEVILRPGTWHGDAAPTTNSVGHRTLHADYCITSHARFDCCSGAAFSTSPRSDPIYLPFRISIGDNMGATIGTERTAAAQRERAPVMTMCVVQMAAAVVGCRNVVDCETRRRIAKRHQRRLNLTEGRKSSIHPPGEAWLCQLVGPTGWRAIESFSISVFICVFWENGFRAANLSYRRP